MVIVQINTVCGSGSTGRTSTELSQYLAGEGHLCFVAYGQGKTSFPNSYRIGWFWENKIHALLFSRILGLQGYGSIIGTYFLCRWLDKIKPDVVHLRNLHGNYLSTPTLFKYLIKKKIPVVMTLHDCYNFTGKCSHFYASGCAKWKSKCGHCPLIRKTIAPSWFFDFSKKIWSDKQRWYSQLSKFKVIAVSDWLAEQAKQSILNTSHSQILRIYNWIDSNKFFPADEDLKTRLEQKYNILRQKKHILTVAAGWNTNGEKFKDAHTLAAELPEEFDLIIIGLGQASQQNKRDNIIYIPYVESTLELSALYSLSYFYVHFSVEDAFGKVIAEAMSCGITPIVYDATACPEIAGPYGLVVKPHDINSILSILKSRYPYSPSDVRNYAVSKYGYKDNAEKYLSIYNSFFQNNS